MIGFFTNLFFYQRLSVDFSSPAENHLGWWAVLVPVAGGVLIGLMARFGSDRIRGHGIPEALEAILFNKSKMSLKVALLKPISSALSIGSGGPFGAEGPIIMTGGAFGSLIAQAFHLTAAERKTLLVAGACAGMAAIFDSPIAAVMLSVELLLFEWKPRSLVPVAGACVVAAILRPYLLGVGPLFPIPAHDPMAVKGLFFALVAGVAAGFFSTLLTTAVYACEDFFLKLPFHWMWYPAVGGLVVGVGGHFEPRALGVGYDVIGDFLKGKFAPMAAFSLMLVKSIIWAVALGSGTSGGVLAPLLILGGGLGVLESTFFPGGSPILWPLISMAAILGGVMRVPFTAVIFALELTRDANALLPLLIASVSAYAFTVLVMKRSILTEKVARRGFHVLREYSVDLLEKNHVEDVMTRKVRTIPATLAAEKIRPFYFHGSLKHQGYPVVDKDDHLLGMITQEDLSKGKMPGKKAYDLMNWRLIVAHPHETCRAAATRMARHKIGRLPVVAEKKPHQLMGLVTRSDLIKPNVAHFEEEEVREKLIKFKIPGTRWK
jgi:H+/Cl- antiporter ClcA